MPWSSTRAFPHPLANIKATSHEPKRTNYLSYGMVDWMTWQGLGGIINDFRRSIDLEPVPTSEGPDLTSTLKIPHTYCWSEGLIPKPRDWADHIDVCGFFFRDPPAYTPPDDLAQFLAAGPPPVYIGFGSIVIDDPTGLTSMILQAVKVSGVRALVSRGWSKLGEEHSTDNVFYLGDCPHEWLFQKVAAVVHHGGAGTTACGLLNARPTFIIPFFGDQPFWGQMVATAGAGPSPIPYRELSADKFASAIAFCMTPEAAAAVKEISSKMKEENGVGIAVKSFHRHLPRELMTCDAVAGRSATWIYTKIKPPMRLSHDGVAHMKSTSGLELKPKYLKHYGPSPFLIENRRWDPVTGAIASGARIGVDLGTSTVGMFAGPAKVYMDNSKKADGEKGTKNVHGEAAKAFGRNMNGVVSGTLKNGMVELPLAMAEGFRNTPRLWGEDVKEQQKITGWKSGTAVAGKNFAYGFYDGVGGLFYKPFKGAKQEGALGFAKGLGKGLTGIVVEPVSGTLGLFGYAGDGIIKSLDRNIHSKTNKKIVTAKHAEAEYLTQRQRSGAEPGLVRSGSST